MNLMRYNKIILVELRDRMVVWRRLVRQYCCLSRKGMLQYNT